jgi:hypothetical protein
MALLSTTLKSILNGSKTPAPTHGEMKGALATTFDFTTELLGTDSTDAAAARVILGLLDGAGMRNVLLNPGFTIVQRPWLSNFAISVTNTDGQTYPYFADRWRAGSRSATYNLTPVGTAYQMAIPAGTNMWQHVPGENVVSGQYQLKWEGSATAMVNNAAVANGGFVTLVGGVNTKVAFAAGTLLRPQLELGSCRAWETRPRALELALCQAFFERATLAHHAYMTTTNCRTGVRFAMRKRTVPTMTSSTGSPNAITLIVNDLTATGLTQFAFFVATAGASTSFTWSADAEIYE